jgi:hypothetical protein
VNRGSRTALKGYRHTPASLNLAIQSGINESVREHAARPERIGQRLAELDREWDIERTLEANAAALAFTGIVLDTTVDRRWLALPTIVTAFLFQHAVQGWVPTGSRAAQPSVSHYAGDRY